VDVCERSASVRKSDAERHTVVAGSVQFEWNLKVEVLLGDGAQVNVPDGARSGGDTLEIDAVYKRLTERNLLDTRVVESVHVIPDCAVSAASARCGTTYS
jgi:hypothetical protein